MKKSELKKLIKEAISDTNYDLYQPKFVAFTKELAKLSKKYGIAINSTGGVHFGDISSIKYSDDLSSGDLSYNAKWKDN